MQEKGASLTVWLESLPHSTFGLIERGAEKNLMNLKALKLTEQIRMTSVKAQKSMEHG